MKHAPKIYLDTSVISGCVKRDMKTTDYNAFKTIANKAQAKEIILCGSTVVKEEIDKIPYEYRHEHSEIYNTLNIVRKSTAIWIDDEPNSTNFGNTVYDEDFRKLSEILPDKNDVRHLFQAKKNGIKIVITLDEKTILSKSGELESKCQMKVYSPSEYIQASST